MQAKKKGIRKTDTQRVGSDFIIVNLRIFRDSPIPYIHAYVYGQ